MNMSEREALKRWQSSDLNCAIIDSGIGFINGYVQLPEGHVGRNAGYGQLNRTISVHGGLTYGTDADGWVGFDTGHAGDHWPGLPSADRRFRIETDWDRAWTIDLLCAEVEDLADQLSRLTSLGAPEASWDCTEDEFAGLVRQAKAWRRLRSMRAGEAR